MIKNKESEQPLLGAIEAGGTKFVCAVAHESRKPIKKEIFPTTTPEETMAKVVGFFNEVTKSQGPVASLGIGTFGPADIHPESPSYGSILTTPKEGWAQFNMVRAIREQFDDSIPICFDTDVNAAAVGEFEFGAGQNHRYIAYITIGTGIGGGYLADGQILHGRMHPEIGHMPMPDFDQAYGKSTNVCPFHDSCFEGRASGSSLRERWGIKGQELGKDHEAWELQAKYVAAGCMGLTATWSPDVIFIGGGVSQQVGLIEKVREEFKLQSGSYWELPPIDLYIQNPTLDQDAGVIGALCLAQRNLQGIDG